MKWLRLIPQQRTPEASPDAREAVEKSRESIRVADARQAPVRALTAAMDRQLTRNHLADRIELAMRPAPRSN